MCGSRDFTATSARQFGKILTTLFAERRWLIALYYTFSLQLR